MKTVLENVRRISSSSQRPTNRSLWPQPEPIKNLNELIKAQLIFFSTAAEALNSVQGEVEELSVAAEGEYRSDRAKNFGQRTRN